MSFGCEYSVGQSLLRLIDGMEFPCQILSVQPGNCYRVKYLGKKETLIALRSDILHMDIASDIASDVRNRLRLQLHR